MVGIGLGRFNTLDSQKEGKHLYFSSELLEEKIWYGITSGGGGTPRKIW